MRNPYANNKTADKPAYPRSLINAFVVRCLDRKILNPNKSLNPKFLVSVAEEAGLSLTRSQTPMTGFLVIWLI